MGLGLLFSACNPMDDIYDDIDAQENQIVGDATYVLTDEDYSDLELTYGSFSNLDDAKSKLPDFFADKYPVWGKGSSITAGFKLYVGNAFKLTTYNLKQEDYALSGSDLLGFQFDATPEDYLTDIVTTNVSSPKEGDYTLAKYFQFTGSAYNVTPTVSLKENFDFGSTAGNLTEITTDWTAHSGAGSKFVGYAPTSLAMTSYPSTAVGGSATISGAGAEDVNKTFAAKTAGKVYFSALVNLSTVGTGTYFFHLMEAANTLPYAQFRARVGAKDNGTGKILFGIATSSSTLAYGTTSFDLNTTYLLVASYDIATGMSNLYVLTTAAATEPVTPEVTDTGIAGTTVEAIGIRQASGGPTATIDGVRVANTWSSIMSDATLPVEVIGNKTAKEKFFTYADGVWKSPSENFYSLTDADFASMGLTSFGSSTPPENYLPTFLGIKFPYAQEGDQLDVMYNYFSSSSGSQTRGNLYTVTDGVWVSYKSTIDTTLQFGHDGTTWVPDNTIKYEFVKADYDYIVATFAGDATFAGAVANLSSYGNISTFNWTPAQIDAAIGAVLMHNFPGMAEGQKFAVTIYVYDGSSHNSTINYILTGGSYVRN